MKHKAFWFVGILFLGRQRKTGFNWALKILKQDVSGKPTKTK